MAARSHFILAAALAAAAPACATQDGYTIVNVDAGPIAFDHPPTTCGDAGPFNCNPPYALVDCICTPLPFGAAFPTTRSACSQIVGARDPAIDRCADAVDTAPDTSCLSTPPVTGESMPSVTLYGVVEVFGDGPDSDSVSIDVFMEGANGTLGPSVASGISSVQGCAQTQTRSDGQQRTLGFYSIANVPSEVPLIVRTRGDTNIWATVYSYGVAIPNADVAGAVDTGCGTIANGYAFRPLAMSHAEIVNLPVAAGLIGTVRGGIVMGEVHDCADVRLQRAQVGIGGFPAEHAYFGDVLDAPVPLPERTEGTGLLGLFAGIGISASAIDVNALGYVDGPVALGGYRVGVFPGAVSYVTLRGRRPWQTP